MRPPAVVVGVLLVVLATSCSSSDEEPGRTSPTLESPGVGTDDPSTSSAPQTPVPPSPTPTCPAFGPWEVSKVGSGFIIEFNIMSGLPNPTWRLGKAEGRELRRLLRTTPRGIDPDGPDDLGGFGVTADRDAVGVLRRLQLPQRFWVQDDNAITDFLDGTLPCSPKA
jgi:hypothetical protein